MTKEIIYLDLADDITTISAKVTRSRGQLIALILPKSLGALKNIVNLRLLTRVAEKRQKSIVLVSNNPDILQLAGQVGLPVARSLRDKPVLPPKPEFTEERVIEESDLTDVSMDDKTSAGLETRPSAYQRSASAEPDVETAPQKFSSTLRTSAEESVTAEDPLSDNHLVPKVKLAETASATEIRSLKDWFKKYMWFIIAPVAALILLVAGVLIFAKPHATVEVVARTSKYNFSEKISFTKNASEANPEQGIFLIYEERLEKTSEYEFLPTGEKEIGSYARGDIIFACSGFCDRTLTVNTSIAINGKTYHPVESTTITSGSNTLTVVATELGEEFNQTTAQNFTVAGGSFVATSMNITGGSRRTIAVVSQSDFDTALAALPVVNRQAGETELANSFAVDLLALPRAAFTSETTDPVSTPAVDEETAPDQRAVVKQTTTFIGYGVKKADLELFIEAKERARLANQPETRIYDLGFDKIFFDAYSTADNQMTAWLKTTTVVGPDLSAESIKEAVAGKSASEATRAINGKDIMNATVRFNFFWVTTVPTNHDRITVEIKMGD
jgi:hypothetical protein